MSEIPLATQKKAQAAIDLEEELRMKETLWTMGLYPSEGLIEEYGELVRMTDELIPLVPEDKDPTELKRLIRRYKRKIRKYKNALKEEQQDAKTTT